MIYRDSRNPASWLVSAHDPISPNFNAAFGGFEQVTFDARPEHFANSQKWETNPRDEDLRTASMR